MSSLTEVQLATEGLKQAGSVALTLKHCSATRREDYLWKYCQKRRRALGEEREEKQGDQHKDKV